jgi:hypothetical protein
MSYDYLVTHKHHIIPRHTGGTDDPSNLIELTVEEHIEAHKELFENHNQWQDYVAWKALSGCIGKDEIIWRKIRTQLGKTGKDHPRFGVKDTTETRKKKSLARMGDKNPMYGKKHSQESIDKGMKKKNGTSWMKGQSWSPEAKEKNAKGVRNQKRYTCVVCGKTMIRGNFVRYGHTE